jgi:hypothetical protein
MWIVECNQIKYIMCKDSYTNNVVRRPGSDLALGNTLILLQIANALLEK